MSRPKYCLPMGLLTPIANLFRQHKPAIDVLCHCPLYQHMAVYFVLLVAVASIVYYTIETVKNITVRQAEETTLYTITGWEWFLKYPLLNVRIHEAITIQYAISVYSYTMLVCAIYGVSGPSQHRADDSELLGLPKNAESSARFPQHDYAAQLSFLVTDVLSFAIKLLLSVASGVLGRSSGRQLLMDASHLAVHAFVWTCLLCNVHRHFGVCKALEA